MARTKVWNGTAWVYSDEALPRSQSAEDIAYDPTAQHTAGSVGAALGGKEDSSNKVTSISSSSTDDEYPSAKAVFEAIGNKQPRLPTEYQEVEYIKSTGTQYIDTGYYPKVNTKWELIACFIDYAGPEPNCWSGKHGGGEGERFSIGAQYLNSSWNTSLQMGDSYETKSYKVYNENVTFNAAKYVLDIANRTSVITPISKPFINFTHTFTGAVTLSNTDHIFLFARALQDGIDGVGEQVIFSSKFYENDTLKQDLVPCFRKSDNEIGMYDLVTNTFFTNQGTGTFLKGADVN